MDIFGAGCVIAELFMEGTPTFTLSQLFKYRSKELNIETHLSTIEDPNIKVRDSLRPIFMDECLLRHSLSSSA